jgi:hypothetical protein
MRHRDWRLETAFSAAYSMDWRILLTSSWMRRVVSSRRVMSSMGLMVVRTTTGVDIWALV